MGDYSDTVGDYLGPTPAQDASYGTFKGGVQKAQADHEAQLSRRAATPYGQFLDMLGTGLSVLPASRVPQLRQATDALSAPRSSGAPPPQGDYFQPPPVREIPPSNAKAATGESQASPITTNRFNRVQGFKDDAKYIELTDPKLLAGRYQKMAGDDAAGAVKIMEAGNRRGQAPVYDDALAILQQRQQTVQDLFRRGLISAEQYKKLRGGK